MKPYLLLGLLALCVIAVLPMSASSSDAADPPTTIEGDNTLTEDWVYADGTTITVKAGAVIDLSTYSWVIGDNSKLDFKGAATIKCTTGSIVVGPHTQFHIYGTYVRSFDSEITYTFNGTLLFSGSSSEDNPAVSFESSDTVLTVTLDNDELNVTGFRMYQTKSGTEISRTFGFSALTFTDRTYDGETLVSTTNAAVTAADSDKTVVAAIHKTSLLGTEYSADITITELPSVVITDTYAASGAVSTTTLTGLGPTQISVATSRIANINTTADSAYMVKDSGSGKVSTMSFGNIGLEVDVDIDELLEMFLHGISGSSPDWLSYVSITSDTARITDSEYGVEKDLTDLSLIIDVSAADYLTAEATSGDDVYTVTATTVTFTSYALSNAFVLDLEATVDSVNILKKTSGTAAFSAAVTGIGLDIDSLDLKTLYMLYTRTGSLAIQHMLDNCDKFDMTASGLTADVNADGSDDVTAAALEFVLARNTLGLYTMTASFGSLDADLEVGGETADVTVGSAGLYVEVSGSMAEVLDSLNSGSHFTTDAHAEVRLSVASFALSYPIGAGAATVSSSSTSVSSPDMTVALSLDHSMYSDTTTLSARVFTLGHIVTAQVHDTYTDPEGRLDVVLDLRDVTGSVTVEYGGETEFTANLSFPWNLDFYYYGIEFRTVATNTALSLTHGEVDIDGFDTASNGILEMPFCLINNDFDLSFRALADIPSFVVYTDEGATLHSSVTDLEAEIKKVSVELRKEDSLHIGLDDLFLSYTGSDGKYNEESLKHLDISKDLSGEEEGKTLLEKIMGWILVPCILETIALYFAITYLKFKKPELFKPQEMSKTADGREEVSEGDH